MIEDAYEKCSILYVHKNAALALSLWSTAHTTDRLYVPRLPVFRRWTELGIDNLRSPPYIGTSSEPSFFSAMFSCLRRCHSPHSPSAFHILLSDQLWQSSTTRAGLPLMFHVCSGSIRYVNAEQRVSIARSYTCAVIAIVGMSVRLSVSPFVRRWYCDKTIQAIESRNLYHRIDPWL